MRGHTFVCTSVSHKDGSWLQFMYCSSLAPLNLCTTYILIEAALVIALDRVAVTFVTPHAP